MKHPESAIARKITSRGEKSRWKMYYSYKNPGPAGLHIPSRCFYEFKVLPPEVLPCRRRRINDTKTHSLFPYKVVSRRGRFGTPWNLTG